LLTLKPTKPTRRKGFCVKGAAKNQPFASDAATGDSPDFQIEDVTGWIVQQFRPFETA
jgi:hypothetical protein